MSEGLFFSVNRSRVLLKKSRSAVLDLLKEKVGVFVQFEDLKVGP